MARTPPKKPAAQKQGKADRQLAALQQAMRQFGAGDRTGALEGIRAVLKSDPSSAQGHRVCALVLMATGDLDRALFHAQKAVALAPKAAPVHTTLGSVYDAMGDADGAIASMRTAVELDPKDVEGLTTLAITLDAQERYDEANAAHERALSVNPAHTTAALNAAISMLSTGKAREAVDLMQRVVSAHPTDPHAAERLAFCINYDDRATRATINRVHRSFGRLLESGATTRDARNGDSPGPIRLGLVSADFRAHSVASFLAGLFEHLDRSAISLSCFFTSRHADAVTDALRAHADEWHDCPGLSTAALADLIAAQNIDVLIDLAGLFAGHRMGTFARTPAPVQATWLGYPNTTGLTRIDARFVDSLTDPPEFDNRPGDARETERLVRLDPCFLCYDPPASQLGPAPRAPNLDGAPFTFASFNDIKKLSPTTFDSWATILTRLPDARLLLKAGPLRAQSVRDHVHRQFADRGVGADRVELAPFSATRDEHLACYREADLALDPYPYCGTTTTCEALWMGVPVLTRVGETHAARVGLSLLTNTGLPELCAPDAETYIDTAVRLATEPGALAAARENLRERFVASPVCDAPAFASRFGAAVIDLHNSRTEHA